MNSVQLGRGKCRNRTQPSALCSLRWEAPGPRLVVIEWFKNSVTLLAVWLEAGDTPSPPLFVFGLL